MFDFQNLPALTRELLLSILQRANSMVAHCQRQAVCGPTNELHDLDPRYGHRQHLPAEVIQRERDWQHMAVLD